MLHGSLHFMFLLKTFEGLGRPFALLCYSDWSLKLVNIGEHIEGQGSMPPLKPRVHLKMNFKGSRSHAGAVITLIPL